MYSKDKRLECVMYEVLITAFEGMEDWQAMHHSEFVDFHGLAFSETYMNTLFENQLANCSRFKDKEVTEAGINKKDIDELNEMGLV